MILTKAYGKIGKLNKRIRVIQGGQGASKTYSILQTLILRALSEKLKITVVTETYPQLKDGAISDTKEIVDNFGIDFEMSYNISDKNLRLGESIIQFRNVDNKDFHNSKSVRRDFLFINEANRITWDSVEQLITRSKVIFIDFNPDRKFWVHDKILDNPVYKSVTDFLVLTYNDNSQLSEEENEEIERRIEASKLPTASKWLKNWVAIYAFGKLGTLNEGIVFPDYHVVDNFPDIDFGFGLDFGFTNDPTALIRIGRKGDDLFLDEMIYRTGLTNQAITKIMTSFGIDKKSIIFADSAEPKSILEMKLAGYIRTLPVRKGADSILFGIGTMRQFRINITKRSENLINEFKNYRWLKDRDGNALNKPIDAFNHGIDAARYYTMMVFGQHLDLTSGKYVIKT